MRPETKLPYGWVNESLAIRDLVESGKKIDYVAELMNKKRKEVERAHRALNEADLFLKEWVMQAGEYQHVEDAEQFFKDLAKALEGKSGEELEASRRIAWTLISNSKSLKRRVYDYNFSFDKRSDEVISRLVDRLDIDLTKEGGDGEDDQDDELDVNLDVDETQTSLEPLIEAFDDPSHREIVENELVAVCDGILEQDRQGEVGRRALAAVQQANSKLQEVDLTKAYPNTYESLESQLGSVIDRASKLKAKLKSYKNDGD
jgi:hypothetical protein